MRAGIGGRWLKFQAVGAAGVAVQLASLAGFREGLGWSVTVATAAAVEISILHNFCWHRRWTWAAPEQKTVLRQLGEVNLTYSLVSITTNVVFTQVYMQTFAVHYLIANLMAIATGGLANFLLGEFFVFRPLVEPRKESGV